MQTSELIKTLDKQAKEIAAEGMYGWGNTMQNAADTLRNYVAAITAIYNHNEAARAAVILHFGTMHKASNAKVTGSPASSASPRGLPC